MLRKKNALMRSGKMKKAATLSKKIGEAINKYNTSELGNVEMLSNSKSVWGKVRQLTGRSKTTIDTQGSDSCRPADASTFCLLRQSVDGVIVDELTTR